MTLVRHILVALILTAAVGGLVASPASAGAARGASSASRDWYFMTRGAHVRPAIPGAAATIVKRYHGLWVGSRRHKVVYLTFDLAFEGGTTRRLLALLDRAHVKATFFLTGQYIRSNPRMTRRIARAGHLVCDHTWSHPDMAALAGRPRAFAHQLQATSRLYRRVTGEKMGRYFRPPFGTYSARAVGLARRLDFTTVFWSFAHYDYDDGAQPPVSVTRARIIGAAYPGSLMLLHAASTSNVAALPAAIHWIKEHHYRFGTVDELR